jgi:origin recognition complex subunit 1
MTLSLWYMQEKDFVTSSHPVIVGCGWVVAEIVAIWKEFTSRDKLEKVANGGNTNPCSEGSWKVEIRWFYERHELNVGVEVLEEEMVGNEVFETDDVTVLDDVSAILAPTTLYSDATSIHRKEKDYFRGHPVPVFLCHRFWSIQRKSLIPCGDLSGREQRSQLYSRIIPKGYPSIEAMDTTDPHQGHKSSADSESKWDDAVKKVIATLNLKEASKGAYNHGETLVGREKELAQLLSFFRAAIHGQPGPGGIRSSMFLAGAPGVGKTACIRSAIKRLESEQARGALPAFNFIALNGMEMRHPFESYVKLWEAITNRKHVGSHEKACQMLEYHFTNPKALDGEDDRSVTIVLLDEIDYLVTEKQSVLYNFFDWPKRAASVPNGRRLVVVGISNTLNLAEQLMPSVQSRVGSERIVFKAYGVKEASAILQAKMAHASPVRILIINHRQIISRSIPSNLFDARSTPFSMTMLSCLLPKKLPQ